LLRLHAVADDPAAAVVAARGEGVDRALEAVERVGGAVDHLERLVVVVAADFAARHGRSSTGIVATPLPGLKSPRDGMVARPGVGISPTSAPRDSDDGQEDPAMEQATRKGQELADGAWAGVIGGVVLSLFGIATSVARGTDVWVVAKLASAPFFGAR